jgi:signal transduction histidine kinase
MKSFWKKIRSSVKSLAEVLEKWRWLILVIIGTSLLWVEVQEFLVLRVLDQAFHYFEVFQYAVLLISTGLLFELFARSNRAHKQALRILEYKHRLSLDLTSDDDSEALIQKLTELPGKIADVDETYLLVSDPLSGKLESAGHWAANNQALQAYKWDPTLSCKHCLDEDNGRSTFHQCRSDDDISACYVYSLGLRGENLPVTVLKFRLKPGSSLSQDDEQIFRNIGDEIVIALQTSRDRTRLSEMQSAQVAMAERRAVSNFVHDQLGQNLGYLHLKLDQLNANENIRGMKDIRIELQRLREVANESYEIVRDILKKIQPETIPHLTNLLQEHARTVSRRAKFELNFKSLGKPVHLTPNAQQLIFFTFRELLSNVEKHANASKVEVLVIWNDGILDISVSDNGRGFDASQVQRDEHFGLEIMQERIKNIKGTFSITSSTASGTVVSISIPLESISMVPA